MQAMSSALDTGKKVESELHCGVARASVLGKQECTGDVWECFVRDRVGLFLEQLLGAAGRAASTVPSERFLPGALGELPRREE